MLIKSLLIGTALLTAQAVYAAPATLVGHNVNFTYDTEALGLFGAPSVNGDSIFFTPTTFDISSANGNGYALKNSTLNLRITPRAGFDLNGVSLVARGDYLQLGNGPQTIVAGQIRAFGLDDPNQFSTHPIQPGGTLSLSGFQTHNWQANAALNLDAPGWRNGQAINLTIESLLLANTSFSSSLAFLEQKYVGATVLVSPVPESDSWLMMLAGLSVVGLALRRRATR